MFECPPSRSFGSGLLFPSGFMYTSCLRVKTESRPPQLDSKIQEIQKNEKKNEKKKKKEQEKGGGDGPLDDVAVAPPIIMCSQCVQL